MASTSTEEMQNSEAKNVDSTEKVTADSQGCTDKRETPNSLTYDKEHGLHTQIDPGEVMKPGCSKSIKAKLSSHGQRDPGNNSTSDMKTHKSKKFSKEEINKFLKKPMEETEVLRQCTSSKDIFGKDSVKDRPYNEIFSWLVPRDKSIEVSVYMLYGIDQPPRHGNGPDFSQALTRLVTFTSFPNDAGQFAINLANLGFIYIRTADRNCVKCWFCNFSIPVESIQSLENICENHRIRFPDCQMVRRGASGNNSIPHPRHSHSDQGLEASGPCTHAKTTVFAQTSGASASEAIREVTDAVAKRDQHATLRELGIFDEEPKHPLLADNQQRRESLNGLEIHPLNKDHLANAGFFFAGAGEVNRSTVHCYCCGAGLSHWKIGDNAWVRHAMISPQCCFLLLKTGSLFVNVIELLQHEHPPPHQIGLQQVVLKLKQLREVSEDDEACVDAAVVDLYKLEDPVMTAILDKHGFQSKRPQAVRHGQCRELCDDISLAQDRNQRDETRGAQRPENVDAQRINLEHTIGIGAAARNDDARRQRLCHCLREICILNLPCRHYTDCVDCSFMNKKCCICKTHIHARCRVNFGTAVTA